MKTVQNPDERTTDPGFIAAQDQNEAAIAELTSLGVPFDRALVIVRRTYSNGLDRGLYLGLRKLTAPPAP